MPRPAISGPAAICRGTRRNSFGPACTSVWKPSYRPTIFRAECCQVRNVSTPRTHGNGRRRAPCARLSRSSAGADSAASWLIRPVWGKTSSTGAMFPVTVLTVSGSLPMSSFNFYGVAAVYDLSRVILIRLRK